MTWLALLAAGWALLLIACLLLARYIGRNDRDFQ